jgi:hypothetical protein
VWWNWHSTQRHEPANASAEPLAAASLPQIEPREFEINEMRETIRAMDAELERYHKSNAGLDLTIQVCEVRHMTLTLK